MAVRKRFNSSVITLFMLSATCNAAWWNPLGDKFAAGNQSLWAAKERLTVVAGATAWTNYMTADLTNDHFNAFVKCRIAKQMLASAVDGGAYTMPDEGWHPTNAVTVNRTNLAARIGVELDWWTNTPSINVMTATNGFLFIPAAMSNVVWIPESSSLLISDTEGFIWNGSSATSIEDAFSDASASEPEPTTVFQAAASTLSYRSGNPPYNYIFQGVRITSHVRTWSAGAVTNLGSLVDVWMSTTTIYADSWDDQDNAVSEDYMKYGPLTKPANSSASSDWFLFGDIQADSIPNNYAIDTSPGWRINGSDTPVQLHRFNGPGISDGFQWFK